jgi:uncharacterized repeat protein (TIGR01451 family)
VGGEQRGPSNVTNARVQDVLPSPLSGFGWTCAADPTAICGSANGCGDIDALVSLPAAVTSPSALPARCRRGPPGRWSTPATVNPPLGHHRSGAGQQRGDRQQSGGCAGDLTITKVSSPNPYVPGTPLTYTVVVSKGGPSNVTNARVQDALPAALAGFAWTCTATPPASAARPTASVISMRAGDAAGGDQCDLHGERDAGGRRDRPTDQHRHGDPPLGTTDPVPGNNQATDNNPAGPQADLAITKVSSPNPYVPGRRSATRCGEQRRAEQRAQCAGAGCAAGALAGFAGPARRAGGCVVRHGHGRVTSMRW